MSPLGDDLSRLASGQPAVADWPALVQRRLAVMRRRRRITGLGVVVLVLAGSAAAVAGTQRSPVSRLAVDATPSASAEPSAAIDDTVTATVSGPTTVVVGSTATYVGHFAWTRTPPVIDVCLGACIFTPLPCPTPLSSEPARRADPGEVDRYQHLTFAVVGDVNVQARAEPGCLGGGSATDSLTVHVVSQPLASQSPLPTADPTLSPTPTPSRVQELTYGSTLEAPSDVVVGQQAPLRAHGSWTAQEPFLSFGCDACPSAYHPVSEGGFCGGPTTPVPAVPGSGDLEISLRFDIPGDYRLTPLLYNPCSHYWQGPIASGPAFTIHVTDPQPHPAPAPLPADEGRTT